VEFFKKQTNIDFLGIRRITAAISIILVLGSLITLAVRGIHWGLDFTGGTVIELQYPEAADLARIRHALQSSDFHDAIVQNYGSARDVSIRLAPREQITEQVIAQKVTTILSQDDPAVKLMRVEAVGSQVGKELTQQGVLALLLALLLTAIYIAFRFEYRFGISAAVALMHDPILILGIFSLFQIEFDLATLAAILAVIGYSLNDTIVVFDRIRENFIKMRRGESVEIINLSINQTLSRTIMTSFLTLLVVLALLFFGGPTLFGFSLAFSLGVIIGTYSSIYIAGALAVVLGLSKKDLMPRPKEELDSRP
jgi:preprotein translocase subunit SecF